MLQTHTSDSPSTHDTILEFANSVSDFTWSYYIDATFEGDHRGNDIEARLVDVFERIADNEGHPIRVLHTTQTELSGLRHASVLLGGVASGTLEDIVIVFRQCDFDEDVHVEKWDQSRQYRFFQPYMPEHVGLDKCWNFERIWPQSTKPNPTIRRFRKRRAFSPV